MAARACSTAYGSKRRGRPRRLEGQHDPRVSLDVAQLHVPLHMAADEIIAVQSDPDDAHLGASVGVDGAQVSQRAGLDQVPQLTRKAAHSLLASVTGLIVTGTVIQVGSARKLGQGSSGMIEARDLTKMYGGKAAVDHLSFTVEPGQVTGSSGPNGAGKSTTMRGDRRLLLVLRRLGRPPRSRPGVAERLGRVTRAVAGAGLYLTVLGLLGWRSAP